MTSKKSIRHRALDLLAIRDHSAHELKQKLLQKGFDEPELEQLIDDLQQQQLLCDQRFSESYVRYRSEMGYGPLRIKADLQKKGVTSHLIETALEGEAVDWWVVLNKLYAKKYGSAVSDISANERAKRARFLYQRGFDSYLTMKVLNNEI